MYSTLCTQINEDELNISEDDRSEVVDIELKEDRKSEAANKD